MSTVPLNKTSFLFEFSSLEEGRWVLKTRRRWLKGGMLNLEWWSRHKMNDFKKGGKEVVASSGRTPSTHVDLGHLHIHMRCRWRFW